MLIILLNHSHWRRRVFMDAAHTKLLFFIDNISKRIAKGSARAAIDGLHAPAAAPAFLYDQGHIRSFASCDGEVVFAYERGRFVGSTTSITPGAKAVRKIPGILFRRVLPFRSSGARSWQRVPP